MKDEYELLHQFEVVFRDGEHRTQAATRDYQQVWKNVIDNPLEDGVTPVLVYRQNGEVCAAIAGMDVLIDNVECSMEIARLAARVKDLEAALAEKDADITALREELDDWQRGVTAAMGETPCLDKGQHHCSCVPFLRMEITALREAVRDLDFYTLIDALKQAEAHGVPNAFDLRSMIHAWRDIPVVRRALEEER